jgi:small GTP-binding protein
VKFVFVWLRVSFSVGFSVETVTVQGMNITAWDVGGRSNIRGLWRHYYTKTEGIVFVIDANDRDRIEEVAEQLKRLLTEEQLLGVPLLIFANKSDLPSALSPQDILKSLKVDFSDRKYHICQSVASTGNGIKDGIKWLTTAMKTVEK